MTDMNLEIIDLSREGTGVARADGKVIFVPYTVPGDRVRVEVVRDEGRYAEAQVIEILEKSPARISPRCRVFGECGGCTLQHLPYERQWELKKKGVLHALTRTQVSFEDVPVREFPAADEYSYRNRIQLRKRGNEIGFFRKRSRELVAIERCEIALEPLNERLAEISRAPESGESIVPAAGAEIKMELDYRPEVGVRVAINQPHAAFGFRQVNDAQNEQMRSWVASAFEGCGGHLFDLFGGNGNLSQPLLSQFESVDVVDLTVPSVSPDPRMKFYRSEVLPWLKDRARDFKRGHSPRREKLAYAIVDPPREGLRTTSNGILEALGQLQVDRFVLISCDIDSYARDVSRVLKSGWKLREIALFDFFPQTPHVESAAVFVRVK